MKSLKTAVISYVFVFLAYGIGIAAAVHDEASVEKGKILFNDPKLGTSGTTCNGCHPDGKGIDKAAGRKDLGSVVNACITGPLQGEALEPDSVEMKSLVLYIKSLGKAKKKKAPVGC